MGISSQRTSTEGGCNANRTLIMSSVAVFWSNSVKLMHLTALRAACRSILPSTVRGSPIEQTSSAFHSMVLSTSSSPSVCRARDKAAKLSSIATCLSSAMCDTGLPSSAIAGSLVCRTVLSLRAESSTASDCFSSLHLSSPPLRLASLPYSSKH